MGLAELANLLLTERPVVYDKVKVERDNYYDTAVAGVPCRCTTKRQRAGPVTDASAEVACVALPEPR